jgi:hypothetical protein
MALALCHCKAQRLQAWTNAQHTVLLDPCHLAQHITVGGQLGLHVHLHT